MCVELRKSGMMMVCPTVGCVQSRSPKSRSSGTAAGTRGLTRLEGDLVMGTGRYRQVVVNPVDESSSVILLPVDLDS